MRRGDLLGTLKKARSPRKVCGNTGKITVSSAMGRAMKARIEVTSLKFRRNKPETGRSASLISFGISFGLLFSIAVSNSAFSATGEKESGVVDNYRKGAEQKRLMSNKEGVSSADPVLSEVAKIAPDLERFAMEFVFGQVLSRPGLDLKQREIATLATLTALGGAEAELRLHVGTALDVGLSKEQIVEVLLQQVVYAGFPRAINALLVAKGVFESRGL